MSPPIANEAVNNDTKCIQNILQSINQSINQSTVAAKNFNFHMHELQMTVKWCCYLVHIISLIGDITTTATASPLLLGLLCFCFIMTVLGFQSTNLSL